MPWRLIVVIAIFAVFLAFITFNLENRCDINFWFNMGIKDVPVFLTIFTSFALGLFCTLPITLFYRKKHREISSKEKKPKKGGIPAGKQNSGGGLHGDI
jgi:uncharacterized integral membrane protein